MRKDIPVNKTDPIFRHTFTVEKNAIDQNGHVNNVVYIQWMQDVAIQHATACGGATLTEALGCTWVVRSHTIDYLSPSFAGDRIVAITWVEDFRKVRSLRRYRFMRENDERLLARGATEWVYVDSQSGRPATIPEQVKNCFSVRQENS